MSTAVEQATIFELADRLATLRERKEALQAELKAVNAEYDKIEAEMAARMLEEEVPRFNRDGRTFYLSTRVHASPREGQREALHEWLKSNGHGDLVKETVHAQSLAAWAREQIEEDGALPDDLVELVNVYEKTSVNIRKA